MPDSYPCTSTHAMEHWSLYLGWFVAFSVPTTSHTPHATFAYTHLHAHWSSTRTHTLCHLPSFRGCAHAGFLCSMHGSYLPLGILHYNILIALLPFGLPARVGQPSPAHLVVPATFRMDAEFDTTLFSGAATSLTITSWPTCMLPTSA